jgi:penicillin-binding protein 1A
VAEVAYRAALPKAPNTITDFAARMLPKGRRDRGDRTHAGRRRDEAARTARAEPLLARPTRRPDLLQVGQHFTEEVRRELIQRFGVEQTTMGGLCAPACDPTIQAVAERSLREGL